MAILTLGVLDVAYSDPDAPGANSTGEVAEILEEKYHVMRIFADEHLEKIGDEIVDRLGGEIESLTQGRSTLKNPILELPKIEMMFRDFLDSNEIQSLLPKRIEAADRGDSSRFKKRINAKGDVVTTKKKEKEVRAPRQAFIDTGLYQSAMRAWIGK